jgi:two-component system, cell cycle sensor histidine kinase and response regulator CckA
METTTLEPGSDGACAPRRRGRDGSAPLWTVVVLGVLLSAAGFLSAQRVQTRRDEAAFERQITRFLDNFQRQRNGTEDVLLTLRAVFNQNPSLSRTQFREILRGLAIRTEAVQALVWAPRVGLSQRSAVEQAIQRDGFPAFQVMEGDLVHAPLDLPQRAADRAEYFPVLYVEPFAGNENALGYDMASVEEVRTALETARESGAIGVSAPVQLPYQNAIRLGFVAAIPVYHPDLLPADAARRPEQLRGFVVAVFIGDEVMAALLKRMAGSNIEVMLLDVSKGGVRQVQYAPRDRAAAPRSAPLTEAEFRKRPCFERPLTMGDREWALLFRRGPGWDPGLEPWFPFTLLACGVFFTALVAEHLRGSLRRARQVEEVVLRRTAELARANTRLHDEIRDRIQAQTQLASDRNLLRSLLDRLPDAVFITDAQGGYLALNEAHRQLLGVAHEEDWLHRAVGQVGPLGLAGWLGARCAEVRQSGTPILNQEAAIAGAAGGDLSVMASLLPLRASGDGNPEGLVVLVRDITEARRAEAAQRELGRRLQEAQKLESLGLLAGGIAHDFNNLLTSVLGNVGLARMELPSDSPILSYLEQIEQTAVRAADLCRQMLAYSGRGRFVVRRLDLSALVQETTELLRLTTSKKAALRLELAPDLPAVSGDPTQLRQIVMNLVINASDAMGGRPGVIRIATGLQRVDSVELGSAGFAEDMAPGDHVFLEVSDTGCGMSPETQAKIFDPFFTTKFAGRGLGLAAVLGIVRAHKGAIRVHSEPGRGSTFTLLLPPVQGEAEGAKGALPVAGGWRGHGKVLVVDDEEGVRRVAARAFAKVGFQVETAKDGREGLQKFSRAPETYRAVVMDLTMPEMDGEEAFREMTGLRSGVRVLLMSGYSPQESVDRFAGKGLGGFIQKPFTAPELLEALRRLLESPGEWSDCQPERTATPPPPGGA